MKKAKLELLFLSPSAGRLQICPIFSEIWPPVKEPAVQHKCEWREILPDIPPSSFVLLAACLSVWFFVYLCVFSEAALLRSPSFRWKPTAWIVSWRKHCVRGCLLAQWLNKQENWITDRHTRPNANSQATQASKGGNRSESSSLIIQTQVLVCVELQIIAMFISSLFECSRCWLW